jgi:predicted nucleic acid-binding protein
MFSFQIVESPLTREVYEMAIDLYRRARRTGKTVRSGIDCLIATCALKHGLTVLHKDRDFNLIAEICPLEVKNL